MMILILVASEINRDVLELSQKWADNANNPVNKEVQAFIDELQANTDCCHSTTKTFTRNPLTDEVVTHTDIENNKPSSSNDAQKEQLQSPILIFMSYSVPKAVWQGLWQESIALKQPIQFVLQGLPNNSFTELAKKITEFGCPVSIDPPLFKRYNITAVPAFLIQEKEEQYAQQRRSKQDHNQNRGQGLKPRQDTLFLGNVSLTYVVENNKQKITTLKAEEGTLLEFQKETRP